MERVNSGQSFLKKTLKLRMASADKNLGDSYQGEYDACQ